MDTDVDSQHHKQGSLRRPYCENKVTSATQENRKLNLDLFFISISTREYCYLGMCILFIFSHASMYY